MTDWEKVGNVPPRELTEARLQLHWAAQLVSAVGYSLADPEPDDSHTALACMAERSLLISGYPSRLVALSLTDLRLVLLDRDLTEISALALAGHTLDEGLGWLSRELDGAALRRPDYEMPAHPIADGEAFTVDVPEAFAELARWFGNASRVLRGLRMGDDLCWPHHFDLAALESLGDDKSIGVGLSPGDGSYDEPYWYVGPWTHPKPAVLPELPTGHWHTEGFVAAILTGSDITSEPDASSQRAKVDAFLEAAVGASRNLLA